LRTRVFVNGIVVTLGIGNSIPGESESVSALVLGLRKVSRKAGRGRNSGGKIERSITVIGDVSGMINCIDPNPVYSREESLNAGKIKVFGLPGNVIIFIKILGSIEFS
jgi:hypothetical protein